ncbi:unnamed protein product [Protopolystoma xenopodis]|uniref:Uncharacterized protein n=1 Tax=Protopolystoma xenopodis TaxID=117903 RepID=A0A448XGK7_9PLAT|nr:unnamed protein product [Protopolystoma xenopodis]
MALRDISTIAEDFFALFNSLPHAASLLRFPAYTLPTGFRPFSSPPTLRSRRPGDNGEEEVQDARRAAGDDGIVSSLNPPGGPQAGLLRCDTCPGRSGKWLLVRHPRPSLHPFLCPTLLAVIAHDVVPPQTLNAQSFVVREQRVCVVDSSFPSGRIRANTRAARCPFPLHPSPPVAEIPILRTVPTSFCLLVCMVVSSDVTVAFLCLHFCFHLVSQPLRADSFGRCYSATPRAA